MRAKIVHGTPATGRTLLVCNHLSFLDVPLIGGVFQLNFVSKDSVADWPLIGPITRLGNTIFISRDPKKAMSEIALVEDAMDGRKIPLCIFPEGTSGDGYKVLPFKSSIFSMFEHGSGMKLQPMAIAYTHRNGRKLAAEEREVYSWWRKEETLLGYFWKLKRHLTGVEMSISFGETITPADGADRKKLAAEMHAACEREFIRLTED